MNTFQSEQKKRRKLRARKQWSRRKLVLLSSVIILAFIAVFFGRLHYKNIVMGHRINTAEKNRKEKLSTIKSLENEKIKLQNPAYVKELARKQLYYMDKNEVHIKIEPDPAKEPDAAKGKQ